MVDVSGINIPIESLSNFELDDFAKQLNIKNYRGTYCRNELPLKKSSNAECSRSRASELTFARTASARPECGILNLDDSNGNGQCYLSL